MHTIQAESKHAWMLVEESHALNDTAVVIQGESYCKRCRVAFAVDLIEDSSCCTGGYYSGLRIIPYISYYEEGFNEIKYCIPPSFVEDHEFEKRLGSLPPGYLPTLLPTPAQGTSHHFAPSHLVL